MGETLDYLEREGDWNEEGDECVGFTDHDSEDDEDE